MPPQHPRRRWPGDHRRGQAPEPDPGDLIFIERARTLEPVVVEVDRPMAYRPRLVGFWRGTEFHLITKMVTTRREYDAVYHRVVTDRGAFDLRHIRQMDPLTLRMRRAWQLCAELDAIPVARLP
jgi:hypothetical protein